MRMDEDYLRELELWPMFALKQGAAAQPASSATAATTPLEVAPAGRPQSAGVRGVSAPAPAAPPVARVAAVGRPALPTARPMVPPMAPTVASRAAAVAADPARVAHIAALDWAGLKRETQACTACGLCQQRKQAVLGVGAVDAPWLFIGEGPGAEEDAQGEPFVGQAGKLLDAMLAATGLARGREVYIANVVNCRPPGNRTPSLDEAQACAPFLDRQIALIKPKLIVALGKTAVMRLTGSDASMASLRGQQHQYQGIPVIATYHPSYLLRNPPEKLKAWEDLVLARKSMAAITANT